MRIELRRDGTYVTSFYSDEKRSFVAVEIQGKWAVVEERLTLTPERHTLQDKTGNRVSTSEVLGESTSMEFDKDLGALVPSKTDTAYGRFIFTRGEK